MSGYVCIVCRTVDPTRTLLCKACARSFDRFGGSTQADVIEWAAKRARAAGSREAHARIARFVEEEVTNYLPSDSTSGVRRGGTMLANMIRARGRTT